MRAAVGKMYAVRQRLAIFKGKIRAADRANLQGWYVRWALTQNCSLVGLKPFGL
jgi:hypothetical protein